MPKFNTLTILLPAQNAESHIISILQRVCRANLPGYVQKQIIIIDSAAANDNTETLTKDFIGNGWRPEAEFKYLKLPNGHNLFEVWQAVLPFVKGEYILWQTPHQNYHPEEYLNEVVRAAYIQGAQLVFTIRGQYKPKVLPQLYGGKWAYDLTKLAANFFSDLPLIDPNTGCLLLNTELAKNFVRDATDKIRALNKQLGLNLYLHQYFISEQHNSGNDGTIFEVEIPYTLPINSTGRVKNKML
ncbi:MAG: glycosyltransferase [Sphingobacteriales bacterium]|nr:glycosyltransferase [Sphingobacteriales bacterium]MBK6890623.1 glycosyltransferase [Sphingobacteriales bacterium]MBK7526323.1 glycosyltransferase [Sphingobacteriales bacterium]MBP9142649.1 glycosyltransferase [Chitinophagales bacterium]